MCFFLSLSLSLSLTISLSLSLSLPPSLPPSPSPSLSPLSVSVLPLSFSLSLIPGVFIECTHEECSEQENDRQHERTKPHNINPAQGTYSKVSALVYLLRNTSLYPYYTCKSHNIVTQYQTCSGRRFSKVSALIYMLYKITIYLLYKITYLLHEITIYLLFIYNHYKPTVRMHVFTI